MLLFILGIYSWMNGSPDDSMLLAALLILQPIQFFCMGVTNIYVGRIWKQVTKRPNAIVAERTGIDDGPASELR